MSKVTACVMTELSSMIGVFGTEGPAEFEYVEAVSEELLRGMRKLVLALP